TVLGFHPLGCICQILSCTSLLFSRLAQARLPHRALFRIKFDFTRSKSEFPTQSKNRILRLYLKNKLMSAYFSTAAPDFKALALPGKVSVVGYAAIS
ncbi:hypothetical protein, partial [Phaeodactylibacter xiamenensis]|uniref:hypothetical protein n=1 Tax=Phaeodactylibacter xiamenensis TaxID=1524460 RepID=UPI0024A9F838